MIVAPVTHNKNQLPYLVPLVPITDAAGNIVLDGQVDTADIVCVSKARLGDFIATLSTTQIKDIDKSVSISLDLAHYYTNIEDKYNKLSQYVVHVKNDRNSAQDTIKQLKEIIIENGFDENAQIKIKELLDI